MSEHGGLAVNRWKRYGMDRLYVEQPDGTKVGWYDLTTGEPHPEAQEDLSRLATAVAGWIAANPSAPAPADTEPSPAPENSATEVVRLDVPSDVNLGVNLPLASTTVEVTPERPWRDLSLNQPGEAAREQALSHRAAAPVKTTLARVLGVHTDERAWRIGADGEERVAGQLAKVAKQDPRWRFLHAVPVGTRGSDIDHVVIGPGGVFTINAKTHPGAKIWVGGNTLMVNGAKTTYVRNARYEAERASRLLTEACGHPVHVEGLIVTVNAADVVIKSQPPAGVTVTWRKNLAKHLLSHGQVLLEGQIDAVYEVARRSTTWA